MSRPRAEISAPLQRRRRALCQACVSRDLANARRDAKPWSQCTPPSEPPHYQSPQVFKLQVEFTTGRHPMALLPSDRYLDALADQSALLAEALAGADLTLPVPTCPDWTLRELAEHVGRAHRWAAGIISRRLTTTPVFDTSSLTAPAAPAELVTWLRGGAD